ncbi:hypothetical protein GCM10009655_21850 [Rhodoglobus aureus]|uniref:Uncharacterized protein n=1 Tax=Rhodoglobus aureus TaxID=191497 RepID=A0ABN1VSM7_9MICO
MPFLLAGSSLRNGYYDRAEYVPASMAFSGAVVQTKDRVTLFPPVLECSYTTAIEPVSSDYVIVEHDLGTGWWIGAPASFLAAAALWVVSRKRAALTASEQAQPIGAAPGPSIRRSICQLRCCAEIRPNTG